RWVRAGRDAVSWSSSFPGSGKPLPFPEMTPAHGLSNVYLSPNAQTPLQPGTISLTGARVLDIQERSQEEEEIGWETYQFDNSKSATTGQENIRVTNRSSVSLV